MNEKVSLVYFSGTGNTRLVAYAAAEEFKSHGVSCSLKELSTRTLLDDVPEGEMLGIAFPVYGLGLPGIMRRFLAGLKKTENGNCFILANAHSNAGLSISQAEKLLCRKGYSVKGAVSTFTPSSSIITEDTEPDDRAEEMRTGAVGKVKGFIDDLIYNKASKESAGVNFRERTVSVLFRLAMPGPVVKSACTTEKCSGCGVCAAGCPVNNIEMTGEKPSWGKSCEVCMRCINLCPNNAVEMMSSAGRNQYKGGLI